MQKIKEKSLVIKSEGFRGGGEGYSDSGKCIIKSRIEFPDPMLITFDTPHGPNTTFFFNV